MCTCVCLLGIERSIWPEQLMMLQLLLRLSLGTCLIVQLPLSFQPELVNLSEPAQLMRLRVAAMV